MIARIKTIQLDNYEDSIEGNEMETIPVETIITFKASDVSSVYIIHDKETKYLYANIRGLEYPLIYEPYLEKVLIHEIQKEEK